MINLYNAMYNIICMMLIPCLLHAISLLKEGEITNNAYHAHVYKAKVVIAQLQEALGKKNRVLKENEKLLGVQEAKIIDLGNDLVDHTQKLKASSTFALERDTLAKEAKEQAKMAYEQERLVKE